MQKNKSVPERVEEVLNDPWLQPIYDSSISKEHKREALETLITRLLTETDQQARERCAKIISELQYQNALIKEGNSPVIKNARNGGYILNEHQRRMDMGFDKALQAISNPPSQV